jgi:riboflavin transporter FmnP
VIPFSALTLVMSWRLKPVPKERDVKIDGIGAMLAAAAVALISLGFDNLHEWGVVLADAAAPFSLLGLSPALAMVVAGVFGIQLFIAWTQRRQARRLTPLLALAVIESPREHAAALAMTAIFMLANALTFLVPLYVQMVQGRSSLATAVAMIPYQLAVFGAAISVLSFYDRLTPRQIARGSFVLVAFALALLGIAMNNEFNDLFVIAGLVMFGLGQGALATLLFNVLVTYAPRQFAGDVGSLRGTIKNLAAGLGTALAGALAVGILSVNVQRSLVDNPAIPRELIMQVNLDRTNFVSNQRLQEVMAKTTATPEQVAEALRINADSRRRALKLSFLLLGGIALLVIVPVGRLPGYVRGRGQR